MTEHHSSRRAKALNKDSERQQERRDTMKAEGAPTTHTVNRAIAEGFLYMLGAERAKGFPVKRAKVSAQNILAYAQLILTLQTNAADSYDEEAVTKALRARVSSKSASRFRIEPVWTIDDDNAGQG